MVSADRRRVPCNDAVMGESEVTMLMMDECRVVLWQEPRVDGLCETSYYFFVWKKKETNAKRAKERTEPRLFLAYQ